MSPQVVVTVAMNVLPAAVAWCGSVAVRAPGAAGGAVQPATFAAADAGALGEAVPVDRGAVPSSCRCRWPC